MVNVDYFVLVLIDELARQDLHVPGEHDKVDVILVQDLELTALFFLLGFLGDRGVVVIDVEPLGNRAEQLMVADNDRDRDLPLVRFPAG